MLGALSCIAMQHHFHCNRFSLATVRNSTFGLLMLLLILSGCTNLDGSTVDSEQDPVTSVKKETEDLAETEQPNETEQAPEPVYKIIPTDNKVELEYAYQHPIVPLSARNPDPGLIYMSDRKVDLELDFIPTLFFYFDLESIHEQSRDELLELDEEAFHQALLEYPGGSVLAYVEANGILYEIGEVTGYGWNGFGIDLIDRIAAGTKQIQFIGGMGAAYAEMNLIHYDPNNGQWLRLLKTGTPYFRDLDGDGHEEFLNVSAGSLPPYVMITRWNGAQFETLDIREQLDHHYAIVIDINETPVISTGKIHLDGSAGVSSETYYLFERDGEREFLREIILEEE